MSINSFLNQTISLKIIIVVGGFWLIVAAIALFYFFGGIKEGFEAGLVGLGTALNYGSSLDYKMGNGVKRSWENNNVVENVLPVVESSILTASNDATQPIIGGSGATVNYNIFSDLEKNEGGPIPLPENELLIFDKNKFSPECCPSAYSNSDGCVCASPEQMKYLNERGGNRTLYGVY
jgi:hypothetical protein